ncbi:microtubule-associated protein 10 [Syngnathoides biaculeatus]|uniref:microtubule-associated protein 10 n=1 Tax=Syngnathoides biaculeatus TaxID=300417 RepID=UPI002ADE04D1|nr:microtubule-associated protein 10 [Syngnathoides biaculeatus]
MCCCHVANIMSRQQCENQRQETLFSFELLVEFIRIDGERKISDELAVGIRLLDFPTLLIYPPELRADDTIQHDSNRRWLYSFNRGKSCFFEMDLDSLHRQLTNTPVYVMILDVKDEIPKFLGTSLISLATIMNRIKHDSLQHGVASCSSYGERGCVRVNNLAEEPIGVISLSYKLLMVGVSLPPHVTKNMPVYREQCAEEAIMKKSTHQKVHSGCVRVNLPTQDNSDAGGNNVDNQAVSTQTENDRIRQIPHTVQEQRGFDEDLSVFCPPCLYYCNSGKEERQNKGNEYRLVQPDSKAGTHKDTISENATENSSAIDEPVEQGLKMSSVAPNVLEEALKPLPLLNALFVELSQLNVYNQHHQPVSNQPALPWINKASSIGASDGQVDTTKKSKSRPEQESSRVHCPHLKHLHYSRNVSLYNMKDEPEGPMQNKVPIERKVNRKKLVYGITKTYNLRRQKNCTVAKHRDCLTSHAPSETRSNTRKGKKAAKLKSSIPKENKDTQNLEVVAVVQDMTKLKHEDKFKLESPKQCSKFPSFSVPHVEDGNDAASNKLPEISPTWSKSKSPSVKLDSCQSTRNSSQRSSVSDLNKEEDYADDFNSFGASDADTTTSPEPPKPTFLSGLHTLDSDSEPVKERPLLPAPVRGQSPVQRALRGTHIIQLGSRNSALSLSSDDDEAGLASVQMLCYKKQEKEESSDATSPKGQTSESSSFIHRGSSNSLCSAPLGAEELEDELGSLDFRKQYQHISELVAFKLPGYTM